MQEDIDFYLEAAEDGMKDAIERLKRELAKIRAGKASPSMLNGIKVEYYGVNTPIDRVANIVAIDARTLTISPWEKKMLTKIEKAIFAANIGLTPQSDGKILRINIPPLTEERRKSFVKQCKSVGEESKIGIRGARQEAMKGIKATVKEGYPEDLGKKAEGEVQVLTNQYVQKVDGFIGKKEKDIMTL